MKNISTHIWLLIAAFVLNTPGAVMATPGSSVIATTDTLDKALNELAIEDGAIGNSLLKAIRRQHKLANTSEEAIKCEATTTIASLTEILMRMYGVAKIAPQQMGDTIELLDRNGDDVGDFVQILLNDGLNPDAPFFANDSTLLHFAVQKGYLVMAQSAIDAGATVNIQNSEGRTPLDLATTSPNSEEIEALLTQNMARREEKKQKTAPVSGAPQILL